MYSAYLPLGTPPRSPAQYYCMPGHRQLYGTFTMTYCSLLVDEEDEGVDADE